MYGLEQAGIIAHNELVKHLAPHGYHPVRYTPGLWKHDTHDTMFTLVVDDFAIKYTTLANAHHLLHALKTKYTISEDWEDHLYIGIALKWDYRNTNASLHIDTRPKHTAPKSNTPHRMTTTPYFPPSKSGTSNK